MLHLVSGFQFRSQSVAGPGWKEKEERAVSHDLTAGDRGLGRHGISGRRLRWPAGESGRAAGQKPASLSWLPSQAQQSPQEVDGLGRDHEALGHRKASKYTTNLQI